MGNGGAGQGARGAGGCGLRAWVCPGTLGMAAVCVPRGVGEQGFASQGLGMGLAGV